MAKVIAIVGTLDTKGGEVEYLRGLITKRGHKALAIDIGMGGKPSITADITAEEVAEAGGANIEELRASTDRHRGSQIMVAGAIKKVGQLHSTGKLDGIIAFGGATATLMGTTIMGALPFGVPKLMVSSWVAVPTVNYFGTKDITIMHSVVEAEGLNPFFKNVLSRAAGAICGMAEMEAPAPGAEKGKLFIAITGYGYTQKCVTHVTQALAERGYEPIRFHATGIGEKAMEELIEQSFFAGVIDLVPSSITHAVFGGTRIAGPERLEVAGRKGIPQVIAPGGVNSFARSSLDQLTPEFKARKHYIMDQHRVTIRMNAEESMRIAPVYAHKLNQARGPVKFLVPLRGWSAPDREGGPLYEPETDRVFIEELRRRLKPEIEIREIDAHIEDPAFAQAVIAAFEEVMKEQPASD
jgi:uncharacterized protein (UPF0261 family)